MSDVRWGPAGADGGAFDSCVRPLSLEGIDRVFERFDKDGNGILDPNEVMLALRALGVPAEGLHTALNAVDVNGDRLVSRSELHRVASLFDSNGRFKF